MSRRNFQQRMVFRWLTVRQIQRVIRDRYGTTLPDDDAGRDDVALVLGYLTHLPHGTMKAENFLDLWAPWCVLADRQHMLREAALSPPPRFTADQLAHRLGVTMDLRSRLALTVIGAIDCDKAARTERRRELKRIRDRIRRSAERRAAGAQTRVEYETNGLSRTKPWEAEGISRRTWYRRHQTRGTSPSPTMLSTRLSDTPVPRPAAQQQGRRSRNGRQRQRQAKPQSLGQSSVSSRKTCRVDRERQTWVKEPRSAFFLLPAGMVPTP